MKTIHYISILSLFVLSLLPAQAQIELVQDINATSEVKELRIITDIAVAGDKPVFFYEGHPEYGDEPWTLNSSNEVVLIKDILPGATSSEPENPVQFGDKVIFSVQYLNSGYTPTITDGTEAGTFPLMDLPAGKSAYAFTRLNANEFFFQVRADGLPIELWRTDGTVNGTTLFATLPSDVDYINNPIYALGKVFFRANTSSLGTELWMTDGTQSGTGLVKDIYEGSSSGNPSELTEVGNLLFFRARTAAEGYELWKSDGTEEGTELVIDIQTGTSGGVPSNTAFSEFDGKLYFGAEDGIVGNELWVSDGTEEGTMLLKNLRDGATWGSPNNFFVFDDILLFRAYGSEGQEIWKTDGTEEGTIQIMDINTGSSSSDPNHFTLFDNKVYFSAQGATEDGLWVTDGTEEGTEQVAAIDFGSSNSFRGIAASSTSLFIATQQDGPQLFVSDGTSEGTMGISNEVTLFNSSEPRDFYAFNNGMIFNAIRSDGESSLWFEQGGTIVDLLPEGVVAKSSLNGWYFQEAVNGKYFFVADTEEEGEELWSTDGTPEGTSMVKDIRPGSSSSSIESVASFGNKIIFQARTAEEGREPWISDGTSEGTVLLKDVNPGSGESNPRDFNVINNKCYFTASDGTGREIWVTDGTELGTAQLVDLNPSADGILQFKFVFNDQLVLEGSEDATTYGYEVVISDLTAEGTQRITDINEGAGFTNIRDYAVFDTYFVFFTYINEEQSYQLWKSDGTAEGTSLLEDDIKKYVFEGAVEGSVVYFSQDENDQIHLQATDESGTTTILVEDIPIRIGGEDDLNEKNSVLADGKLFITDGIFEDDENYSHGSAIWVTDGTVEGTVEIATDASGNTVAPLKVFAHNDDVYFNAYNSETNGYSLWYTDGTKCGTQSLSNDPASILGDLAPINGYLYFRGYTANLGSELYRYDLSTDIPDLLTTWYRDADGDGLGDASDAIEDCEQPDGYVSNDDDCDDTDDSNSSCTLGVEEPLVKIYPNPSSDFIHIDSRDVKQIQLIDLNGKTLLKYSGGRFKIDIQNLKPGIYLLKVADENSNSTHKIVKTN